MLRKICDNVLECTKFLQSQRPLADGSHNLGFVISNRIPKALSLDSNHARFLSPEFGILWGSRGHSGVHEISGAP